MSQTQRWGAVGEPVSRVDGPLKAAGAARFAAEVRLDGLAYAAIVPAAIAKGRIVALDTTRAETAGGVIAVMTHRNAPRLQTPPQIIVDPEGASFSDAPVMQDDRVRWNGEAVAVVVAETQDAAEHAASLVRVSYAAEPARLVFEALLPSAHRPKTILGQPAEVKVGGDAEPALRAAAVSVDETYRTPIYHHNAIEPHAVTAVWDAADRITLHDSTQMLAQTAASLARTFELPTEKVRVLSPFVGGGFGGKGFWSHTVLAVAAAKMAGRPVRLALSREGVFRLIGGRALSQQRVALGAKADGTLAALIHTGTTGVVTGTNFPEQFTFNARHLYAADALHVDQAIVEMDIAANCAMRAPGESIGSFALESALDELAVKLELDPVELRRRIEPDKDPTTGQPFSSRNLVEAYRQGAERFGWAERNPTPGARREGEWRIGQGVATAYYPYYRRPNSARIRLTADGRAVVQAAAHEMGMGTATVQSQLAAEQLGLPLDRVTFALGDSSLPQSTIAGGSAQSASIAAAIIAAREALVEELLKLAGNDSPLAGASPKEVESRDGGLFRIDGGGERYQEILRRAGRDQVECEAAAPAPEEMAIYSMLSLGAQFCEVRVSDITGEVRVSRWLGSFDTGRILNPKTAASQFRGGIIMGIGMALTEETLVDARTGRIMNPSLAEYHVPTHLDVPPIEVIWTGIPDPQAPLGVHG
ncbi:MAG: Aerobic-type carbon monoxide dehydrogenase, large subunit CoxL/CutL-like protein, partial [Phenylobacterium sp.]|nr:Aerobic-type carbon monoxide dehydrogenase, large subunit CoxL/CutL-like protein [Phenylobacterium sp.]